MTEPARQTPATSIRMPVPMRTAYHQICERLGTTAAERILTHIREDIHAYGTAEELLLLVEADAELTARRARMHPGRPRKQQPAGLRSGRTGFRVQAAHESAARGVQAQAVRQGGEFAAGRLRLSGCHGGVPAAPPAGRGAAPT